MELQDLLFVSGLTFIDSRGYIFVSDLNFCMYCFALEQINGDELGDDQDYMLQYRYSVPLSG